MSNATKSVKFLVAVVSMLSAGLVYAQNTSERSTPKLHVFTNVSGTGTAGRIVKWTDTAGTLADSVIAESSGNIGIGASTISNKLHIFTTVNADGVSADGTQNPAFVLRNNGTVKGYLGLATASTAWFSNAASGDLALRSEGGNVLLGRGGLAAAMVVAGSNVGIGTTSPSNLLHLYGTSQGYGLTIDGTTGPGIQLRNSGTVVGYLAVNTAASQYMANASVNDLVLRGDVGNNIHFGHCCGTPVMSIVGNAVGIGTTTPEAGLTSTQEAPLHVYSAADKNTMVLVENAYAGVNSVAALRTLSNSAGINMASHSSARTISRFGMTLDGWNEILSWYGNGLVIGTSSATPIVVGTNNITRMTIDSSGNFTIGSTAANSNVTVNGTLTATKVIGAVYQDVAEWVPATTKMSPGTVVVLNRERRNEVMPSAHPYDTAVAGVVSEQPGLVLGVASDSKAQVATTGRVKVHVDATAAAIRIGDLLVTGDKPGTAMKSQPVDLGGVQIHRPGTVIGKALEPLPNGEGDILVLLSLQ